MKLDDLAPNDRSDKLGVITHGSLNEGVEMKLRSDASIEDVEQGTFAVIQGKQFDFFSMVTDVEIDAANEEILLHPPGDGDDLLREVLRGSGTYATVSLQPQLMMPNEEHQELSEDEPRSVKTIPAHFADVARATEDDVSRVFGHASHEDGKTYFHVGDPRGMEGIPVHLNLEKFVERSNAIFGKTGTGKSFLARLLLCGAIKTGKAVSLIFDMHSEYGWSTTSEEGHNVRGLKKLFPSKVSVFSLDPEQTRSNTEGISADFPVHLYADQIEPADILPLRDTLNLTDTAAESTFLLRRTYKKKWLQRLLDADQEELEEMADTCGAHLKSVEALKRKLAPFLGYDFFHTSSSSNKKDVLDDLIETLSRGNSIVFEFGRYDDLKVYLFVANVITRRLRTRYMELKKKSEHGDAEEPTPLIITIEEAHKFLTPDIAHETSFGKIAREMRKYNVSLLVVDQRPSSIDDEVLSQIGTKMVAQLNDDKDIAAALVGTSGASGLRSVLASLDAKQQALLLGHAVPMPIVIKSRTYDQKFYEAIGAGGGADGEVRDWNSPKIQSKLDEFG
jgi:DNA helicase HerA-like ATPase